MELSFIEVIVLLKEDLYFRIFQDDAFDRDGGLLLPLQAGARNKPAPVGAPILE